MRRLNRLPLLLLLALPFAFAACRGDDTRPTPPETPVSATPDPSPQPAGPNPLDAARRDLAERLDIEPGDVELSELRHAGWDGCYGVRLPDAACPELFVGGVVGLFTADERTYRYHFAGGSFVATDFVPNATIDDGSDVPPELQADLVSLLAGYTRGDLAIRLDAPAGGVIVEVIAPLLFSDGCLGLVERPDQACDSAIYSGAIILLAHDGERYRYHAATNGRVVPVSFLDGETTHEPDRSYVDVQLAMRTDLAGRLSANVGEVSMNAFREVTWPDGCLGVRRPAQVCTQALVDGFRAELIGSDGKVYLYHGAGDGFIATDFERGATIDQPVPREPD